MSSLLGHCHGENWKSPTRSFGRSGKAKRTFRGTKKNVFCSLSTIIITKGQGVRDFFQYLCKRQASVNGSVATRRDNARRACPLFTLYKGHFNKI